MQMIAGRNQLNEVILQYMITFIVGKVMIVAY